MWLHSYTVMNVLATIEERGVVVTADHAVFTLNRRLRRSHVMASVT